MVSDAPFRDQLERILAWEDSHVGFDAAVGGIPEALRGQRPAGLPHSPWEIVEHIRRAQRDILDFCQSPNYHELKWPDDYWPSSPAPSSTEEWDKSVRQFHEDRTSFQQLAKDATIDLTARIPRGDGQTYLREILLAADHCAYHIGELVVVRRLLGAWKGR